MIRFRVIRASRLLLGFAIAVLVAVLALIGFRLASQRQSQPPVSGTANLVSAIQNDEARTEVVFASSDRVAGMPLDPGDAGIEIEILSPAVRKQAPKRRQIFVKSF